MTEATRFKALADDIEYAVKTEGNVILFDESAEMVVAALRAIPQEPVAWRWRHVNSETGAWCYQHHQYETTSEYIEQQPLYAAPIQSSDGDVWTEQDIAEARAEAKVLYDYFHPSEPIAQGQRESTIEECARFLEQSYPGHAWLNAACAAIRSLSMRSALAPSAQEGETSPRPRPMRGGGE